METLLIGLRFVQFVAVMTLFGSSLFPYYALRRGGEDKDCLTAVAAFVQNVALCASLAALLSAVGWLGCEAVLMSGDPNGYKSGGTILTVLDSTEFGRIWRWRLVLLVMLPLFLAWRTVRRRRPLLWPVLASAILLVASLAGIGHGAMGTGFHASIHLGNQAIHLLAASVWVGGLLSLFHTVRWAPSSKAGFGVLTNVLKRFSAAGFGAVLLIVFSGGLNSWFLVGSLGALLHTVYGHVLMIKLSFFFAMILLALFNRLVVMPRFADSLNRDQALRLLFHSVVAEQALAVIVVASISVLGTLTPAVDVYGMTM